MISYGLKASISETHRDINAMECTDRHKRRKKQDLADQTFSVPVERRSAKAALKFWAPLHYHLNVLTMLIRCLAKAVPKLRKTMFLTMADRA